MLLLRGAVMLCMAMSVMVLAQMVFLGTVSTAVKMRRGGDGSATCFPMVLVQIPMDNERCFSHMSRTEDNMQLAVSQTEDNMQFTEGARSKLFVAVSRATSRVGYA